MKDYIGNEEIIFKLIGRGVLCALLLMLIRRTESKFCSTTGLSYKEKCCHIEEPLVLPHGLYGIVIAPNVRIGRNVTIIQRVTIAKENEDKNTIIGDNVVIYTGAIILNNVHIGSGSVIGANAVVTKDVEENSVVVGIPANCKKKRNRVSFGDVFA